MSDKPPAAKKLKITDLRWRLPFVSNNALACMLKLAEGQELPTGSRTTIRRCRDAVVFEMTPYGPLHQKVLVGKYKIEIQNPFAMYWQVCKTSESFSTMMLGTLHRCGNDIAHPWSLIFYTDEVTPGNQLRPENERKLQCAYWSIMEFGPAVLANEDAWMEITCVKSTTVKVMPGNMSELCAALLKVFFSKTSHNMETTGILLELSNGTTVRIFIKFDMKLADESALHMFWGCKGSSGLKCCLRCQNCFDANNKRNIVRADTTGLAVDHTCCDPTKFIPATKASIMNILNHLRTQKLLLENRQFKSLETDLGWNLIPTGVMLDPDLAPIMDPAEQNSFDPMHVYFVGGVFNVHVGVMMHELKPYQITYEKLHEYASLWHWPARVNVNTGVKALDASRAKGSWKAWQFKASASEGISIVPVLAHYARQVNTKT